MKSPLLISTFLCFAPFGEAGGFHLICPEKITAVEGDPVTLQYRLDRPKDLSAGPVGVKRTDLSSDNEVHVYRQGRDNPGPQMPKYRERTTLDHADLMRGNMTLQISSVNLSDSGSYKAFVPQLNAHCTTELIVELRKVKRPVSITTPPPPADEGTKSGDQVVGNVKHGSITAAFFILPILFSSVALLQCFVRLCVRLETREMIKSCLQRLRGRRQPGEAEEGNDPEGIL